MASEDSAEAFDADLAELRALVARMGGLAEVAIDEAVRALTRRDVEAAARVVEGDARIDALEGELERLAMRMIAAGARRRARCAR